MSFFLKLNVYFTEVDSGTTKKYVPRSVQVDLESGVTDRVRLLMSLSNTISYL